MAIEIPDGRCNGMLDKSAAPFTMAVWRRGAGTRWISSFDRLKQVVLRRPVESGQYTSEAFQRLLRDLRVTCSLSRSGDVWDNAVMESFFSTLKTERTNRKHYGTRNAARADVFDYIERFYNPIRRHSTLGNLSPIAFERGAVA